MTNPAQKTPISLLQELCANHGMTPDYKLMSVEGAVHAPTFMYRVQVNDVVASATGQSKKKAKHAAAKTVLEMLLSTDSGQYKEGFVSDGVAVNANSLNEIISESAECPITQEEGVGGNPVGELQEMCMKQRWQPPYYETEKATGLPHEKIFSIICVVDKFTTSGEGKSKRLAKRQAADNMLKRLKSLKLVSEDEIDTKKFEDLKVYDKDDPDSNQTNLQKTYSKNVVKFLKDLKTSTSSFLMALLDIDIMDPKLDCVRLLQNIASEQNFDIIYIPIEQKGRNGDYHCLLQITSLPVAVCFGSGGSKEEAQMSSARNALNFIQLMYRK